MSETSDEQYNAAPETEAPLDRGTASIFVDRWLWASEQRKSRGESWSFNQKADVVQMLLDSGFGKRSSAQETSVSNPRAAEGDRTCAVGGAVLPGQPVFVDAARGSGPPQKATAKVDAGGCFCGHSDADKCPKHGIRRVQNGTGDGA